MSYIDIKIKGEASLSIIDRSTGEHLTTDLKNNMDYTKGITQVVINKNMGDKESRNRSFGAGHGPGYTQEKHLSKVMKEFENLLKEEE